MAEDVEMEMVKAFKSKTNKKEDIKKNQSVLKKMLECMYFDTKGKQ